MTMTPEEPRGPLNNTKKEELPRLGQGGVQLLERPREPPEALAQLLLRDDERRAAVEQRRPEEADQAVVQHGLAEVLQERREGLAELLDGLPVPALKIDATE